MGFWFVFTRLHRLYISGGVSVSTRFMALMHGRDDVLVPRRQAGKVRMLLCLLRTFAVTGWMSPLMWQGFLV